MACKKAVVLIFMIAISTLAAAPAALPPPLSLLATPRLPQVKMKSVEMAPVSSPQVPTYASPSPAPSPGVPPKLSAVKGAYWPSWTDFPVSAIDTSYFTHIYYAFVLPDPTTYELVIPPSADQSLMQFTATLHGQAPPVRALLSIGGGGNNATVFSQMVSGRATRSAFINSTIDAARKYNLDGLDLDWEFPSDQDDMDNLGLLFKEWREAVASVAGRRPLLLTAAVYFASHRFFEATDPMYPGEAIRMYMDWVNVMCFDYRGPWDISATGAQAALYDPRTNVSTSYGIQSWLKNDVPPKKVVMGLPLYGRTWVLKDPRVHGIGAPAVAAGPGNGTMVFKDVVDFNAKEGVTVVYDNTTVSMYSYVGTTWIGYDNGRSVAKKIKYAKSYKLGGYFFWALGYDDKDWAISRKASNAWDK